MHIGMSSDFWWKVSTECISVIAQAWWEYCDGLSVVCRHFQLLLVSLKSLSIYVGFVSSKDVSNTLKLDWKSFSFPFHCFFITWFSLSFYFFPFPFLRKKNKHKWQCVKIKAVSLWRWFQGTLSWYLLLGFVHYSNNLKDFQVN